MTIQEKEKEITEYVCQTVICLRTYHFEAIHAL